MLNDAIIKAMTGTVSKILYLRGEDVIHDVTYTAIESVLSNVETFDAARGTFKGWCCAIAKNAAFAFIKRKANSNHDSVTGEDDESLVETLAGEDGAAVVERRDDMAKLTAAIATLSAEDQEFIGHIVAGKAQGEAGEAMGWNAVKASRRYHAIVEALAAKVR